MVVRSRIVVLALSVWLIASLTVLFWHIFASHFTKWTFVYYFLWVGIIGGTMLSYRSKISTRLLAWRAPEWLKFIALGYAMVLIEEILAALTNTLAQGFTLTRFLIHIPQFWDYNLLAFTGLIVGLYLAARLLGVSRGEVLFLAGLSGLYAERTYQFFLTNQTAFFVLLPVTFAAYALILMPSALCLTPRSSKLPPLFRAIFALAFIAVASILPVIVLGVARSHWPFLFPPRAFIP